MATITDPDLRDETRIDQLTCELEAVQTRTIRLAAEKALKSARRKAVALSSLSVRTDEEHRQLMLSISNMDRDERAIARLKKQERKAEKRASIDAAVIKQPRTYGEPNCPNSYWMDRAILADEFHPQARFAAERMAQWTREVAYEVKRNSAEGKRAASLIHERERCDSVETHRTNSLDNLAELRVGMDTTGTSGGAFTSPIYDIPVWAPFRGIQRCVADVVTKRPVPQYGMNIYVMGFSGAAGVAAQIGQNQGLTEVDPGGGNITGAPFTLSAEGGQINLSMQLYSRGGMDGYQMDELINQALTQAYNEKMEALTITAMLANAASVTGQATVSIGNMYQDIAVGREKLTDTAGTRLRATHVFTTSDFYSYVSRQLDATTNRPVFVPQYVPAMPPYATDDDSKWQGFTGTVLPAGLLWFQSDSASMISSTTSLILVSRPDTVLLYESDPYYQVLPQTNAASLTVVARLYSYVAVVPRYPNATASISGSGYTTSLI